MDMRAVNLGSVSSAAWMRPPRLSGRIGAERAPRGRVREKICGVNIHSASGSGLIDGPGEKQMNNDYFLNVDHGVVAITIVTGSVLVITQLVRLRRTTLLHRTVRDAVNSNSPLAPVLIEKLDPKPTYEGDARTGMVLLAIAVAMVLFGLIQGGTDHMRSFISVAMFPAAVGAVLFGRAWKAGRKGADG